VISTQFKIKYYFQAKNQILEGKLAYQELRARQNAISEGNILANLKQENRALWMRLKEVEANAQEEKKEVMNFLKYFLKFGQRLGVKFKLNCVILEHFN
jgi:hypothetical protein